MKLEEIVVVIQQTLLPSLQQVHSGVQKAIETDGGKPCVDTPSERCFGERNEGKTHSKQIWCY